MLASLYAPDIIFAEVSNAILRKKRTGQITVDLARAAILAVRDSFGRIHESRPLLERAAELSIQFDHSLYDCLYLACAEAVDAVLVTADDKLAQKVAGTRWMTYVYGIQEALPLLNMFITPMQVREVFDLIYLARETRKNPHDDRGTLSFNSQKLLKLIERMPQSVREDLFAIASFPNHPVSWSDVRANFQPNDRSLTDLDLWEGYRRLFGRDP